MFPRHISNKYAVPTELKSVSATFFYKHIVPTGLRKLPNFFYLHEVCATYVATCVIITKSTEQAKFKFTIKSDDL